MPDGLPREHILAVLGEVLGMATITEDDNFFFLGGDSFAALDWAERTEADLDIEFPLTTLFTSGRIGDVLSECAARVSARSR